MTAATLAVMGGLIAVGAVTVVVTVVRHPVARRLAWRSAGRRRSETVLVIVGSLLGTAIITGSLTVGDSLDSSIRAGAFTQLGPVDETVTAPGVEALAALRDRLGGLEEHPAVDGLTFGLRARGTAATGLPGPEPDVAPDVLLLEVDLERAAGFGGDPAATGLVEARTPQRGEVVVSTDLADRLGVQVGDQLSVFAYGTRPSFEVVDVLPRIGLAGYSTGLDAQSLNVFLPPGTISEMVSSVSDRRPAAPPVALGFVSNHGGVLDGVEHTDEVTDLVRDRLGPTAQAEVTDRKRQLLDTAEETGSWMSEVFLAIGAFAVIAGILLLVNVFVMLAEERRNELGIMRAVGMRRSELVRAFFLEGGLYAAAAAVLGAFAGIGVGAGIMQLAKAISAGPAGSSLELRFAASPVSIGVGLLVGLLIALVTILLTSIRISRLNIIRAIRDLPVARRRSRGWVVTIAGGSATGLGVLTTVAGVTSQDGTGLFLGPAILAVGLAALLGRIVDRRHVVTVLGLAVAVWGLAASEMFPDVFHNADVIVFVVQGLVLTGAAIAVLARNQHTIGRLVRRAVGGVSNVTARLGLAYPMARPFRTTMTLAMYALVVFTLVQISVFTQAFGGQVGAFTDAESGGYDLLVGSAPADPLPADEVRQLDAVRTVAPLRYASFNIQFRVSGQQEFRRWFASGFDRRLLQTRPPALDRWLPGLPDDEHAVWQHVLDDPGTMIADARFLQEAGTPQQIELGDVIDVRDPITGTTRQRTIVAMTKGGAVLSGAFLSDDSLTAILGPRASPGRLYVALDDDADPRQIADRLESEHLQHGVRARTFRSIVAQRQQDNLQFLRILQGYLMLGLLVGIAGLAVVMVRAVRERRQRIGVLRAVGLQPGTVGRSFMLEAAFISLQGIVIGALLGAATARQLIVDSAALGGIEVGFTVPWAEIGLLLAVTLAASVLAAGWPAHQASTIRPAVALRTTE